MTFNKIRKHLFNAKNLLKWIYEYNLHEYEYNLYEYNLT